VYRLEATICKLIPHNSVMIADQALEYLHTCLIMSIIFSSGLTERQLKIHAPLTTSSMSEGACADIHRKRVNRRLVKDS
jgi:hypothetical protein